MKNDFFHYAFSCFGENSFIDKVEFFKNFVDISCVFCGWYLDWRVSLGIVRGVVSHEFSMKFPFYSTAKLLVILAHFSHRKLTNTTIMLIFFLDFFMSNVARHLYQYWWLYRIIWIIRENLSMCIWNLEVLISEFSLRNWSCCLL